ncbi:hypothetical protein HAX54_049279, partial [Datura stramonium]|nr:hypothetical protein [Datura stramonium]
MNVRMGSSNVSLSEEIDYLSLERRRDDMQESQKLQLGMVKGDILSLLLEWRALRIEVSPFLMREKEKQEGDFKGRKIE